MKKLFVLISLVLLALSGKVFADDDTATNFHGNECEAYFAGDAGKFSHYWNGIYNNSASGAWVSCPIDKDEVLLDGTDGLSGTWVRVTSPSNVTCTLVEQDVNANWIESQNGTGNPWIYIPPVKADDRWGANNMYCFMPAGSTLNQFSIFEY